MDYWKTPIDEFMLDDSGVHLDAIKLIRRDTPSEPEHNGVSFNLYKPNSIFFNWVLDCSKQYLLRNFNEDRECYIDRAWSVVQNFGLNNDVHSHGPFHMAAVYYVNANSNHPELEIFDPRPPHIFNLVYRKLPNGNLAGGFRSIKLKPITNKLIIFPGYLLHGVGTNMIKEPRVCISMNINVNTKFKEF